MAAWKRAKAELQRDADGRAELLRVALGRWNSVLASLDGVRDASERLAKLGGLLDSLTTHARALDELQRLALVDPLTRVHNQVKGLSTAQRRKVLLSLVQSHGADLL